MVDAPPTPSTSSRRGIPAALPPAPIPAAPPTEQPRSETTQASALSNPATSFAYGRTSTVARTSVPSRSSQPSASASSTGRAAAAAAYGTGCWSRKSRTRVSSGVPPPVARNAGTASLRASAA